MAYGENFDVNGIIVAAGCNYNTITGNKITNGYRNIVATATNSNLIKRLRIENNHLTDGSRYATNISYNDSLEIIGNTVYSGYVAPTSSRYGIQVNNSTRNQIIGNKIHMHMAGYAYGIFYQSNADAQGSPSLIANNFSMMTGSSTQYGNHALNYNASSHTRIYHNSFMIATGNSNAGTINFEGSCSNVDMKNNVIANLAGGLAINHYASAGLLLSSSDYNNFYTTGATLAKWNTSTLVPVSGGIAAWTALTLRDSNSIMLNPMFYSNTNLHSYSPLMNNAGTPLAAVTVDIDGEPRSVTAPDIGADEYTVSAIDAGAISIVSPSATMTQGATTPVKVVIRNYGSSNLTAAQVQYSLNGAAAQSINWAGSLTTGQTDTVTFPVIAVPPLQYSITAYTVLTGDTLHFNDTVTSTFYGNPLIDARVEEITSPIGGCNPGNEVVSIVIKNVGLQNIATGLTAHYQLANTSTVISEPITQVINTNATLAFTFATPVNIQSPVDTIFILKAWVSHLLDPNPGNDTLVEYISVQGPLPAPVVSDTTISYGQTVTLNAVSNYPVEWYASASSTSKLFAGAAFTTPPLFDTTVYYVEANTNIPSGEFFAGQGTNVSGQYEWPNPLGKAFGGSKHQFLILASELVSQGYSAG
ncbi:MAG: hypothetical protein EHM73_13900, partial [Chroococcales cyanobacterium metabat2.561]